jgi:hypothetical protein
VDFWLKLENLGKSIETCDYRIPLVFHQSFIKMALKSHWFMWKVVDIVSLNLKFVGTIVVGILIERD